MASPRDTVQPRALRLAACVALVLLAGCYSSEADRQAEAEEMPPLIERELEDGAEVAAAPAPVAVVIAPMPPPPAETDNTEVPVDIIVASPPAYLGQPVVGTATVAEVPFDRGFWIEKNGQRMFAVIAQSPNMEQAVNVEAGQTLRLAGIIYDSALASDIAGQMDAQAMETISNQPAFLLVDARNISIIDAAAP